MELFEFSLLTGFGWFFFDLFIIWVHFSFKECFIDSQKNQANFKSGKETSQLRQSHYDIIWVSDHGVSDSWELEIYLNGILYHNIFSYAFSVPVKE